MDDDTGDSKTNAADNGDLAELKALLKSWSQWHDREDPYAFVGRDDEQAVIHARIKRVPPIGGAGSTLLVIGAPGAGKTCLANHVLSSLRAEGEPQTALIEINGSDLKRAATDAREVDFLRTLAMHLAVGPDPASPDEQVLHATETRAGTSGTGVKHTKEVVSDARFNPMNLGAVERLVPRDKDGLPAFGPAERVVVYIDEVQEIVKGSLAASIMNALHLQKNLPVQVICTGLSDSIDAMDEAGVSRPAEGCTIRLGALSHHEAKTSVLKALGTLAGKGMEASTGMMNEVSERLAKESDGWPKHLQTYMGTLFRALDAMRRPSLLGMELDAVLGSGNEARRAYYADRLARGGVAAQLAATLVREIDARDVLSVDAPELIELFVGGLPTYKRKAWERRFEDGGSHACFRSLVHAGLIERNRHGLCRCPMPSLSTYVQACAQDGGQIKWLGPDGAAPQSDGSSAPSGP